MKNGYRGLSKDEIYLISRAEFEKQKLITTAFVQKVFVDKNKAARVLVYLKRKGRLLSIEKGKYLLVPLKAPNQRWMPNEFVAASLWMVNKGDVSIFKKLLLDFISFYKTRNISLQRERPKRMGK